MTVKNKVTRDEVGRFKTKLAAKAKAIKDDGFTIASLMDHRDEDGMMPEILVRVHSRIIPAFGDDYIAKDEPLFEEVKLEDDYLLITEVQDNGESCYVMCSPLKNPKRVQDYDFPPNFKCYKVTDKQVLEQYAVYQLKNLEDQLDHHWEIGCDPEIFVKDKQGKMIPAWLFLGSKKKPDHTPNSYPFYNKGGFPMYWDGYQAEFTTLPDTCLGWHMDSIAAGMRGVYDAAVEKFPGAQLSLQSVYDIDYESLQNESIKHVEFGCMPSFNAYGLKVRMPPPRKVPFRSAGGHLHFGIGKTEMEKAIPIVKALDAILGVACVSLFAKFDNPKRRKLYGLPGEFRLPKHGIEYRPLSNAWLAHPFISNLVIDIARNVVVLAQKDLFDRVWDTTEEETVDTIVNCDVKTARVILERNKEVMMKIIGASYAEWAKKKDLEVLFNVFMNGMEWIVGDPNDFVTNWTLDDIWVGHSGGPNMNVEDVLRNRRRSRSKKIQKI